MKSDKNVFFLLVIFFLQRQQREGKKIHVKCLFVAELGGNRDERLLVRKDSICTIEKLLTERVFYRIVKSGTNKYSRGEDE